MCGDGDYTVMWNCFAAIRNRSRICESGASVRFYRQASIRPGNRSFGCAYAIGRPFPLRSLTATLSLDNNVRSLRVLSPHLIRTSVKKPVADWSAGKTTTLKDMKNVAAILLGICILLTILLIKEDRAVPGHYTGWGAPNM